LNSRIIPVETPEVVTSSFQCRTYELAAITILIRVITVEHPEFACSKTFCLFWFS